MTGRYQAYYDTVSIRHAEPARLQRFSTMLACICRKSIVHDMQHNVQCSAHSVALEPHRSSVRPHQPAYIQPPVQMTVVNGRVIPSFSALIFPDTDFSFTDFNTDHTDFNSDILMFSASQN